MNENENNIETPVKKKNIKKYFLIGIPVIVVIVAVILIFGHSISHNNCIEISWDYTPVDSLYMGTLYLDTNKKIIYAEISKGGMSIGKSGSIDINFKTNERNKKVTDYDIKVIKDSIYYCSESEANSHVNSHIYDFKVVDKSGDVVKYGYICTETKNAGVDKLYDLRK